MKRLFLIFPILFIIGCAAHSYNKSEFIYYAPQTNQPNCAVGAFCLLAYERLNKKTSPLFWETNTLTHMNKKEVNVEDIPKLWNSIFSSNKMTIIYDADNPEKYETNIIDLNKPYLWAGIFHSEERVGGHASIIYFNSNSVTFKHFIVSRYTHTNYMTSLDYSEFFKNTYQIYDIHGTN